MIAFDLDGVFLPDSTGGYESLKDFLTIRSNFFIPLFIPKEDYYIVTGRPEEDLPYTKQWIDNFVKKPPSKLFHSNPDLAKPALYKAAVLNENPEIHLYVESSPRQCQTIIENLKRDVKVVHFESMIHETLQKLSGSIS